jgi:hypothetical protein
MLLDIILLLTGAAVVTFCAIEGFIRALMQLIIFYVISIIIGMVLLSVNISQDMARRIASMIGGIPNQTLFEAGLFLAILIPTTLGIFLLTHFTMNDMRFSHSQWLDTILAVVCGVILSLVLLSLLSNTWGLIVSTAWTPERAWSALYNAYASSVLRDPMKSIMEVYRSLLFPFRMTRYPLVYGIID